MKPKTNQTFRVVQAFAVAVAIAGAGQDTKAQVPATAPVESAAAPAPVFAVEIGRVSTKLNPDLAVDYSIRATAPLSSKAVSQKLRFLLVEDGLHEVLAQSGRVIAQRGTSSRYLTINTGKYKTLGQLKEVVAKILQRFVAGGIAPETDLGKIGDARYGGELHFITTSPEVLRCEYVPTESRGDGFRFRLADAKAFLAILNTAPASN